MKTKILSLLLLLVVAVGFSGLATAASQQVLVSEAYDEQVLVSEAYDEQVLVTPAWNETIPAVTHTEQRLVSESGYQFLGHEEVITPVNGYEQMISYLSGLYPGWNMISHPSDIVPAVYETVVVVDVPEQVIHHEAVYETVTVIDVPAHNESVVDVPGHYISVEADHDGYAVYGNGEYIKKSGMKYYAKYMQGQTFHGFVSTPVGNSNPCQSKDWKWVPVSEQVWVPATYKVVEIPAVTHEEQQLVSEAYDEVIPAVTHEEEVLVSEAYQVWHADVYDWVDAVYEEVVVVDTPEQVIEHPAVFENVHHEAVYKTVHHDAVYKTVEVPEKEILPDIDDVPMQPTGGLGAVGIALAALLVLVGAGLIARRK